MILLCQPILSYLNKFSGCVTEWRSFWQLFFHTVDSVQNLHPTNKLIYLRESFKGQPLNMIKHLPLIESSYSLAINILSDEYGNENTIIKSLYNSFLSIKPCDSLLKDLRRFLDKVSQILLQLSSLTVVNIQSVLVVIEKRVSFWLTKKLVSLELNNTNLSINSILRCLRDNIKIKELSQDAKFDSKDSFFTMHLTHFNKTSEFKELSWAT